MRKYSAISIKNARSLRAEGKTYSEIQDALKMKIPKSTLSSWCSDIQLPAWFHKKIEELNVGNIKFAQQSARVHFQLQRERIEKEAEKQALETVKFLDDTSVLKMQLAMLHLGEGSKAKSHHGLMLGSSDSDIISLYVSLLRRCYDIRTDRLRCRVSYRADQDIASLQSYWSRVTLIPLTSFYKTKPDSRTQGKVTQKTDYRGVCVISCINSRLEQLELEAISKHIIKELATGR